MQARRYNKDKIRYELIPNSFKKELAKVYTIGAEKYTIYDEERNILEDGANNWKNGLKWKSVLASIYRHLEKFEQGEDFDTEYPTEILEKYGPTYHIANAAWGLSVLQEFYKTKPQLDDRDHSYLKPKKIGLDIDEVLADWVSHWTKHHGQEVPETWNFDRDIASKFELLKDDKEFWLSIPIKTNPRDIGFEPHCYITSRNIPVEWTQEWLDKNGFPTMPVYSVGHGVSKVDVAKESGIDMFVDDRYDNFVELNRAGILCYLFDAPHNQRYEIGYKRIYSLKELS